MHLLTRAFVAVACVVSIGCYHATVETGAPPSPEVINKSFASGWILGLVPPSTVSTAAKCPNGAAKVETQLSFVNQLVSFLTLGIYTPMEIRVTCAAARSQSNEARTDRRHVEVPPSQGQPEPSFEIDSSIPSGLDWVADRRTRTYMPVGCREVSRIAPADRLFYSNEASAQAAGYKRSEKC
jgi:Bor protein